jgi:Rod binding domain-containing protein
MAGAFSIGPAGLSPLDVVKLTAPVNSASGAVTTKAKAHAAAQSFEAVFLNSMFSQMQTDIGGDGPFGGSGAEGVWRSMLTDEYAKSFAKAGGVGIASHVYQSLMAMQEQRP